MKPLPPAVTGGGAPPRAPVKVWTFAPADVAAVDSAGAVDPATADGVVESEADTAGVAGDAAPPLTAVLNASAAACPVNVDAAVSPASQFKTAVELALHEDCS